MPSDATNLTVNVSTFTSPGEITIELCAAPWGPGPCLTSSLTNGPGGSASLDIDKYSDPPLNAGRYLLRVRNRGPEPVLVKMRSDIMVGDDSQQWQTFRSAAPEPIADDGLTVSTIPVQRANG